MDYFEERPGYLEDTDYRTLTADDLAVIFKIDHIWTQYFYLLHATGIDGAEAAILQYQNLSRERNLIGYYSRFMPRYREESIPQKFLEKLDWGRPLTEPLFPSLYPTPHSQFSWNNGHIDLLCKRVHEKLSVPTEFLETLLLNAGRPEAGLDAFKYTFLGHLQMADDNIPNYNILARNIPPHGG